MTVTLKELKPEIDTRLTSATPGSLSCCQLEAAQDILNNCVVLSYSTFNNLPDAQENEGRIAYVRDIKEYRYSNGMGWAELNKFCFSNNHGEIYVTGSPDVIASFGFFCSPVREFNSLTDWCKIATFLGTSLRFIKTSDSSLWSFGDQRCGFFGNNISEVNVSQTLIGTSPIREISSSLWCEVGRYSSGGIKTNGQLWTWGSNSCGQLGDGTTVPKCSPVRERSSSTNWCKVDGSQLHSAAIKRDGSLWAWGCNWCGMLGDGTTINRCSPVREISSSTNWCELSLGARHTFGIRSNGTLWSWGVGSYGVLGNSNTTNGCSIPLIVPIGATVGQFIWCQVSSSCVSSAAIQSDGSLWAWGENRCGQLARGVASTTCIFSPVRELTSSTNWCHVLSTGCQMFGTKLDGSLWSWGYNLCGILGDGTVTNRCSPVLTVPNSARDWDCAVGSRQQLSRGVFLINRRITGFCS